MIALTAQAHGAGNAELVGAWLHIGLLSALALSVPVGVIWWFTGDLLRVSNITAEGGAATPRVIGFASTFARLSILWLVPDSITSAYAQWITGLERVRETVPIHVSFTALNLLFNVVMVHGVHLGGREYWAGLGFVGSPIATALTTTARLATLVLFMAPRLPRVRFDLGRAVTRERVVTFLRQGVPSALSSGFEQSQLVVMSLMIAQFGAAALAADSAMMSAFDLCSAAICTSGHTATRQNSLAFLILVVRCVTRTQLTSRLLGLTT